MPKRSYRKKSGKGKKGSHKGSKRTYRKKGSRKGSKKSYRKKASKKVSKRRRTIRKVRKASPCVGLDETECGYNPSCEYKTNRFGTKYCKSRPGTLYKKKLSQKLTKVQGPMGPPAGYVKDAVKEEKKELDKAEAVLDKKEEKVEAAIVAGAPAAVIAELKEEVKEAKEVVEEKLEKLEEKVEEAKDFLGVGVFGDLGGSEKVEPMYDMLFQRIRRRIKGSKRGRKSRGKSRKTSRGKKSRGKKSRGKKKSRKNSGFRSRHMM
jgi:hypothetical protein